MFLRKFFALMTTTVLASSIICVKDGSGLIAAADLAVNLDGKWKYTVELSGSPCAPPGSCTIEITGNTGKYTSPANNNSLFLIDVYSTPNRGRPVVTIIQTAQPGTSINYNAALAGRIDYPTTITGFFVDVDNNRATFTLKKL